MTGAWRTTTWIRLALVLVFGAALAAGPTSSMVEAQAASVRAGAATGHLPSGPAHALISIIRPAVSTAGVDNKFGAGMAVLPVAVLLTLVAALLVVRRRRGAAAAPSSSPHAARAPPLVSD